MRRSSREQFVCFNSNFKHYTSDKKIYGGLKSYFPATFRQMSFSLARM